MAVTVDKEAATVQIDCYPAALAEAPEIVGELTSLPQVSDLIVWFRLWYQAQTPPLINMKKYYVYNKKGYILISKYSLDNIKSTLSSCPGHC